jgi:hypothetical protein
MRVFRNTLAAEDGAPFRVAGGFAFWREVSHDDMSNVPEVSAKIRAQKKRKGL